MYDDIWLISASRHNSNMEQVLRKKIISLLYLECLFFELKFLTDILDEL